jgi:hypothetical protein
MECIDAMDGPSIGAVDTIEPVEAAIAWIGNPAIQPSNKSETLRKLMTNPQPLKRATHKIASASLELSTTVKPRNYIITLTRVAPQMVSLASIVKECVTIEDRPAAGGNPDQVWRQNAKIQSA